MRSDSAEYGIWSCTDSASTVRMLGRAGYDYVCLDLQHGLADPADLHQLAWSVRAGGSRCVVRVPWNRPEHIMRAVDLGAQRVVVPMVESAHEARRAVDATRYPRAGTRSWGPLWPSESPEPQDAEVECFVMVETRAGLDAVDAIAATPGLAGIYIGPNDLALAAGHGRATYDTDPGVDAMLTRVVAACRAAGITAGLHCSSVAMAAHWAARGVAMLTAATDHVLLEHAVRGTAAALPAGRVPRPATPDGRAGYYGPSVGAGRPGAPALTPSTPTTTSTPPRTSRSAGGSRCA